MLEIVWPWSLAALPLPVLVYLLLPAARGQGGAALRVPFFDHSRAWIAAGAPARRITARAVVPLLAWCLLALAAARPQWVGEPLHLPVSGRDLLLAVDISGSMRTDDMRLNGRTLTRLEAVKAVGGEFISRREGDRVGLIVFGAQAYLQAPLTFDRRTVRTLLEEAEIGLAGGQTAIGDAIGLAIKRLRSRPARSRVLVLLTDGSNTAGRVGPVEAAEVAAREGIRVHAIGVGADEALRATWLGGSSRGASELDEETLRQVAGITGGRYFRARETDALEEIYAIIDRLEPVAAGAEPLRPRAELYPWPLGLGLGLAAVLLAVSAARGRWGEPAGTDPGRAPAAVPRAPALGGLRTRAVGGWGPR